MGKYKWQEKAKIYQLLIDRFDTGKYNTPLVPDFMGGNIKNILKRLNHIGDMGFNAIWLSPFFQCSTYHGYHITDYYNVDNHFGSFDDLDDLILKSHEKGIKIIADFVPNHCSASHPFFVEALKNKKSAYRKWFHFTNSSDDYLCFLSFKELPKLNLSNLEVASYIIENALFWLSRGIDGLRVDHVIGIDKNFRINFKNRIKKEYPESFIFGEAWGEGISPENHNTLNIPQNNIFDKKKLNQEKLQLSYRNDFDGILDFVFKNIVIKNIKNLNTSDVEKEIENHFALYDKDFLPLCFLDNHDTNRLMHECSGDKKVFIKALTILAKVKFPKIIYYGTEQAMSHRQSINLNISHSDLRVRKPLNWNNNFEFKSIINLLFNK